MKKLGGQADVDPLESTQLIFNLRQAGENLVSFHPTHERCIPKTHLLPEEEGQESLVPVGAVAETYAAAENTQPVYSAASSKSYGITDSLMNDNKTEETKENKRLHEKMKSTDSTQNSLEKAAAAPTNADGGLTFSSSAGVSRSLPSLGIQGSSIAKSLVPNRDFDPFASPGFIIPPMVPEAEMKTATITEQPAETSNGVTQKHNEEPALDPTVNCDVSQKVRMQYEKLPYPFRNPDDDKKALTMPLIDNLMIVNQRCYQGKKDFHGEFRVLVAGGGTGDASTYLAVQTAWLPNAKVVYVDLSTESMKIAKERLHNQAVRLGNPNIEKVVEFHHASLLDVEKMGIGKFDYINCSGVLHHLKDPNEGLAALRSVLKDDGAMSIMVYGQIGRTSIYQVQELMRIVNRNVDDMDEKIKNTNLFLRYLPSSNLHRLGGRWGANESNPIEIYDLFLHSQDRAYTVDQLYDWVEGCGMNIVSFSSGQQSYLTPEFYPHGLSHRIRERIKQLNVRDQRIFSELLYGHVNKFEFQITPRSEPGIDLFDLDLIPCFTLLAKNQNMPSRLSGTEESASLFHIPNHLEKLSFTVHSSPFAKDIYRLIDDTRTIREMLPKMQSLHPYMSEEAIHRDIIKNLKQLMQFDIIHLRHKSCRCELLNRGNF